MSLSVENISSVDKNSEPSKESVIGTFKRDTAIF